MKLKTNFQNNIYKEAKISAKYSIAVRLEQSHF